MNNVLGPPLQIREVEPVLPYGPARCNPVDDFAVSGGPPFESQGLPAFSHHSGMVDFEGAASQDGDPQVAHSGPAGGAKDRVQVSDEFNPFLLAFPFDDEGQLPISDNVAKEAKMVPDDCNRKVPGLSASPLAIDSIWHGLCRQVFQSNTQFGFFFRALAKDTSKSHEEAPTASVFPMPLPYCEVFRRGGDAIEHAAFKKLINLQVGVLNWLHLHQCRTPPSWLCGKRNLTALQSDVVKRLWRLGEAWSNKPVVTASEMGRTAAKQEGFEDVLVELDNLAKQCRAKDHRYMCPKTKNLLSRPSCKRGSLIGRLHKSDLTGAMNVVASRIRMSGRPTFDPRPFLSDEIKQLYDHPLKDAETMIQEGVSPPRVLFHASFREKIAVLELLERSGRLGFRSIHSVYEKYGNGLFSVPKDLDVDRLILDARPSNLLQCTPNRFVMSMASSYTMLGMHLEPSEKLLMSGDDLSNFFYTFHVGEERITKNFLEWRVPVQSVSHMKSFPPELQDHQYVYACLTTLAMGDGAACEFAQSSHVALGLQSGALDRASLITLHGVMPRKKFAAGIIIDDLIFMEKVDIEQDTSQECKHRRTSMHNMYRKVGLEAHPKKGFEDQSFASFWGADVDGLQGLVRGNITRGMSLCWIALRIASLGISSVGLLESLAGGFVSLFAYRRRLLSTLDHIYGVQAGRDQRDIIRLPPELIDELTIMAILAPLAVTDLRAGFSTQLFAVDASDWGEAVVSSEVGPHMGRELHRHGLRRSVWTKMLSPFKRMLRETGRLDDADQLPEGEEPFSEHPLWQVAAKGLDFCLRKKRRAKRVRHINLGEVRSYLDAEEIAGLDKSEGPHVGDIRVPILADSQVSLGAIAKGRSSSPGINRILKASLGITLGLGVYSTGAYVKSSDNAADDPTRGQPVRKASIELPRWWVASCHGDHSELDCFLRDCGLHPEQLDKVPDLEQELLLKDPELIEKKPKSFQAKMRQRVRKKCMQRKLCKQAIPHQIGVGSGQDGRVIPWSIECDELLKSFPRDLFVMAEGTSWPPTKPGFLDLYSGKKGFARSSVQLGAAWVLTIDFEDGPHCNLLDKSLQQKLMVMLKGGVFNHFSAAPVCASFSRAITPAVRSHEYPLGVPHASPSMKLKLAEGNEHLNFVCKMIAICISLRIHYWFENPDNSHMWYQKVFLELLRDAAHRFFRTDFCVYGTAWRKRTRFITSSRLGNTKRLCNRQHVHQVLRGRSSQFGKCWTKVAEPYPRKLCNLLAWAACADVGVLKYRSNINSDMAKCTNGRIGEASNPGPRKPKHVVRGPDDLVNVELVQPGTEKIGGHQWECFVNWINVRFGEDFLNSLWLCPSLMGHALAQYGLHLYETGASLYKLRHLITFVQRKSPLLRGQLGVAWEMITKWEKLEPVEHRRPIPLKLLEAMASVGLLWKWNRFAGCIILAFHGCTRMGEILRAKRKHLVLPTDLSLPSTSPVFLRIVDPKPGRKGLGKIQHVRVDDVHVTAVVQSIFGDLDGEEQLYPGTPGTFRRRWDRVLRSLEVPLDFHLTPGGLRAGGTIELYRKGIAIHDLLWRLRLRHLETLQHYLQEVSTDVTMYDMPFSARALIGGASNLYPLLLSTTVS